MADRSEVLELLRIVDLARQYPHLKDIHDHAMGQLVRANDDHKPKKDEAQAEVAPARTFVRPAVSRG